MKRRPVFFACNKAILHKVRVGEGIAIGWYVCSCLFQSIVCILALVSLIAFVSVSQAQQPPQHVDFQSHIIPLLTKHGCNAGSCHGAAVGRGQFRLSLWGSDPDRDYASIVEHFQGRRIDLHAPSESLLLRKPLGDLEHGGDQRFDESSLAAQCFKQWITQGAVHRKQEPSSRLTVERWARHADDRFRLRVWSHHKTDTKLDVTAFAHISVEDGSSLAWDEAESQVTILRPGQHRLFIRYRNLLHVELVTKPYDFSGHRSNNRPSPDARDRIDQLVDQHLQSLGLVPSPSVADEVWLRRVYLDLIGAIPSEEELRAFESDRTPNRIEQTVDRLLESPRFAPYWAWHDWGWMGFNGTLQDEKALQRFALWLEESYRDDVPRDRIAMELLVSEGDSHEVGATTFTRLAADPMLHGEAVGRYFMGARMQCAHCHNHPLDRWTMDDYFGLAAIFAKLDRGPIVKPLERSHLYHPQTQDAIAPKLPGESSVLEEKEARRDFALWNLATGRFAEVYINRLWGTLFGYGLVDPMDDWSQTNPPIQPELLQELAASFRRDGYHVKPLLKRMVLSEVYRRECEVSEDESRARHGASRVRKPLTPEVYSDLISAIMGSPSNATSQEVSIRTWHGDLSSKRALQSLGACPSVACLPQTGLARLSTQLHLLQGNSLNQRLSEGPFIPSLLGHSDDHRERLIFGSRRLLSRNPTEQELRKWLGALSHLTPQKTRAWYEDWAWALTNSLEFQTIP